MEQDGHVAVTLEACSDGKVETLLSVIGILRKGLGHIKGQGSEGRQVGDTYPHGISELPKIKVAAIITQTLPRGTLGGEHIPGIQE